MCALLYGLAAVAVLTHASSNWLVFITIRLLCGAAVGGFTVACPLYLSELSPAKMRGRVVGVFQIQVGVGVIVAFAVGAVFAHMSVFGEAWKLVLGLGALPSMLLAFIVRSLPSLNPAGCDDEHRQRISWGGWIALRSSGESLPRLFHRRNVQVILVATSVAVFNQLSGVNILLLYMLEILASTGISLRLGHNYTVVISGLSLVTTLAGMVFVDRLGRKPLLYIGSAGMAVCLLLLGLAIPLRLAAMVYVLVLAAYNAFFAFSQGTVVWVYLSELFPPGLRGPGQGYGSAVHWIVNAALISIFPSVQHASTVRVFYAFALMMVVQIVVIRLWYPETRGTELGSFSAGAKMDCANRSD